MPLGVLCGAYKPVSQLAAPFVEFARHFPAPAFGALAVAILGIHDAPKVAIIFIGTFFQMVLVSIYSEKKEVVKSPNIEEELSQKTNFVLC